MRREDFSGARTVPHCGLRALVCGGIGLADKTVRAPRKFALIFLFTAANKLLFAQWKRGDFRDFVWEYHHCNFFVNFSCHHNM
jgi:hypothetical protein